MPKVINPDARAMELADQWGLGPLEALAQTPTAQLWRCGDAVLKVFSDVGQRDEAAGTIWLEWAGGRGSVVLHKSSKDAQLLGYCKGPSLSELSDERATDVFCDLVMRFPTSPVPDGLVPLKQRWKVLLGGRFVTAHQAVETARFLAEKLLETTTVHVALHGDLHHENIMHDGRTWRAIDPKGVLGDPCYDLANMFLNPVARPEIVRNPGRVMAMRDQISNRLGHDPNRIMCFAFVHAVVACLWSLADGDDAAQGWAMVDLMTPFANEAENALFP